MERTTLGILRRARKLGQTVVVAALGVTFVVAQVTASSASPRPVTPAHRSPRSCEAQSIGQRYGAITITTDAGPVDSPVSPGQTILVSISWVAPAGAVVNDGNCVRLGETAIPALRELHEPAPADGHDSFSLVVPSDAPPGGNLCDAAVVSAGRPAGFFSNRLVRSLSAEICYRIGPAPVLPEVSSPVLLPAAALAAGGGVLAYVRRRGARGDRPRARHLASRR